MATSQKKSLMAAGLAALILAGLLGFAAWRFAQYGGSLARLEQKSAPIMIAILDPHTGQETPAGSPLLVHVEAGGPNPLLSLELYANGRVVGIQGAPGPAGLTPFSASFAWTPDDPGPYSLIARGIDAEHHSVDSDAVVVLAGPPLEVGQESPENDTGQSVPIANGGGGNGPSLPLPPPPGPPGGSDSIGPAQTWTLSVGDWLTSAGSKTPAAPELTAGPAGCGATLSLHDLSEGEDGFILFRMTAAAPMPVKIATLVGQSDLDWLTYTDESYTSSNSYMARAFDGTQASDSNIVFVEGDPADCAQSDPGAPLLSIQLTSLETDADADRVYCYKSLNGIDWSRWPVTGFLERSANGFDIQGLADTLLLDGLDAGSLSLDLECWGWVGGAPQRLGSLHQDGLAPGDLQLVDAGLAAGLSLGGIIETKGGDSPPKPPTNPFMPKVLALLFFGPDACTEHTPSGGSNAIENLLLCSWYPEYNSDQGGSQPYLVWYVLDGECLNGEDCRSFQYYLDRAEQYDGKVGFNVYNQFSDSVPIATTSHDLTAFVVKPQMTCGEDVEFLTVRMYYLGGPADPILPNQMMESPDSNTISAVFNCPLPEEITLDVFFDTLHIGDLGDGAGGGDDLEIYASFAAEGKNPGSGSVLNLGYWGWSGGDCPDDSFEWYGPPVFVTLDTMGIDPECPLVVEEGDTDLAQQGLCASDTYSHCASPYSDNNNKIQVTVGDGSQLRIAVHAMDYDENSGDDQVCQAETTLGPQSIFGWEGFSTSGSLSQGDNDSASCVVLFHVAPASP